jgi:hypothetical protein
MAERERRLRRSKAEIMEFMIATGNRDDVDFAEEVERWSREKIAEGWRARQPLEVRWPGVAAVAAKHLPRGDLTPADLYEAVARTESFDN